MATLYNSLAEVATGYSVFEKDQVLTEAHLNSVSQYLDDQDRLTRINLIGVGIVCGLEIGRNNNQITLSAGTGITTDGDLVHFPLDQTFDRFKSYNTDAPQYPPLYIDDETMLPAFELVATGTADVRAQSLADFNSASNATLDDMTALLLVESYIKDDDLCSGTGCDNRGQDYVSNVKLLLIDSGSAASLMPNIRNTFTAANALPVLAPRRALINATHTTTTQINSRFISASNNMLNDITTAFNELWENMEFVLTDAFPSNPVPGWLTRLNAISQSISASSLAAQYLYDFLKDIMETWNDMRSQFASTTPWCCPDVNAFPKHLLLGDMVDINALDNTSTNRFSFYASPAVSRHSGVEHAAFLAKKIGVLIDQFAIPQIGSPIAITPSFASRPLHDRAIPFYYGINSARDIVRNWNFTLTQRNMASHNYGYHHQNYGAQGAAANPLQSSIDQQDFFRIEGHIGQNVDTVLSTLENLISEFNLPFAVTSVFHGTTRGGIRGKRGAGYTDLNRFHRLLRQDLSYSMNDVSRFSNAFNGKISQAVSAGTVSNDATGNDGATVLQVSESKHTAITNKSQAVQNKMNLSYQAYRADPSWKTDIADAMTSAGEYKYQLGRVVKTEFVTPFDSLIGSVKVDWLDWLDVLIDSKDETKDERRLLREFIRRYPGMEHSGGVNRGGTFVLIYDSNGRVVADFMLAHYLIDEVEEVEEEPNLPTPGIRPGWVVDSGINIMPSIDHVLTNKLDIFKLDLDQEWNSKFNLQTSYTAAFQDSIGIINEIYTKQVRGTATGIDEKYQDKTLGLLAQRMEQEQTLAQEYATKAQDTTLPAETRAYYEKAVVEKQQDIAKSSGEVAEYLSVQGTDVSYGSDGFLALQQLNRGKQAIANNDAAKTSFEEKLTGIQGTANNPALKQGLDAIVKLRF